MNVYRLQKTILYHPGSTHRASMARCNLSALHQFCRHADAHTLLHTICSCIRLEYLPPLSESDPPRSSSFAWSCRPLSALTNVSRRSAWRNNQRRLMALSASAPTTRRAFYHLYSSPQHLAGRVVSWNGDGGKVWNTFQVASRETATTTTLALQRVPCSTAQHRTLQSSPPDLPVPVRAALSAASCW